MHYGVKILFQLLFVVYLVDAQRKRTTIGSDNLSTTHRPDDRNTITCKLPNSYEADPYEKCSHFYYQCNEDSIGIRSECQNRLWYAVEDNACLEYHHVPACTGLSHEPHTTTISWKLTTVDQSIFDCTKLRSGNYAVEKGTEINGTRIPFCSNSWYTCDNGRLVLISHCDDGFYFDHDHDRCDEFDMISDCNGGKEVTRGPTTLRPRVTTADIHLNCKDKADGKYPDPDMKCSHTFFYCSNNIASQATCASNTVYNQETLQCENRDNVFDCTGVRMTSTPRPSSVATAAPYYFNCTGLENKMYPNPVKPCSSVYFQCANGVGVYRVCAAADLTALDVDNQICDYKKNIPACTGKPRPTKRTIQTTDTTTTMAPATAEATRGNGRRRTTAIPVDLTATTMAPVDTTTLAPVTEMTRGEGRRRTTLVPSDLSTLSTLIDLASATTGAGRQRTTVVPSDLSTLSTLIDLASATTGAGRQRTTVVPSDLSTLSTLIDLASATTGAGRQRTTESDVDATRPRGRVRTTPFTPAA